MDVRFFRGSNLFLQHKAVSFNIPEWTEQDASDFKNEVLERFPQHGARRSASFPHFFAQLILELQKVDMDLYIRNYNVSEDNSTAAVECLDEYVGKDAVTTAFSWFRAIRERKFFDLEGALGALHAAFEKTLYSGPTIYAILEAAQARGLQALRLPLEGGQLMLGYGRKQVRCKSTTFHVDSVKDVEFTEDKQEVKSFLAQFGWPVPKGETCSTVEEAIDVAEEINGPVCVKPLDGHKGEGVTTNVTNGSQLRAAFEAARSSSKDENACVIVEEHVEGHDYRLLAVGCKFVAAVRREPASVVGDGRRSVRELVDAANASPERKGDTRSALCKIRLDSRAVDCLREQGLDLDSVLRDGQRVALSPVANLSQGGSSVDVTGHVHEDNVKLVDDIAAYFQMICLGIDMLSKDISRSWRDGGCAIVEINAGPGVFMHIRPAVCDSARRPVDVPGAIIAALFRDEPAGSIPIVSGNRISLRLASAIREVCLELKPSAVFGSLTSEGLHVNGKFFSQEGTHDQQVLMLLRNLQLDFAVISHSARDIRECGQVHHISDVVILTQPSAVEQVLLRDLRPGGVALVVGAEDVRLIRDGAVAMRAECAGDSDAAVLRLLRPTLELLLTPT